MTRTGAGAVDLRMHVDDRSMMKSMRELRKEQEAAAQAAEKLAQSQKRAGDAAERGGRRGKKGLEEQQSTARGVVTELGKMAAQWASVTVVIQGATRALRAYQEEQKEQAQAVQRRVPAKEQLLQLAQGSESEFRAMVSQGKEYANLAGIPTEQGYAAIVALESAGLRSDYQTFARSHSAFGADVRGVARGISTIRTNVPGAATNFDDFMNRALVASGSNPDKLGQLIQYAGRAAEPAQRAGLGVPGLLAATSILASGQGGIEQGTTQLRALLNAVSKRPELAGGNIFQILDQIEAAVPAAGPGRGRALQVLLGGSEGTAAFGTLQANRQRIQEQLEEQRLALEQTRFQNTRRIAENDVEIATTRERQRQANYREEQATALGLRELRNQTIRDEAFGAALEGGMNPRVATLGRFASDAASWLSFGFFDETAQVQASSWALGQAANLNLVGPGDQSGQADRIGQAVEEGTRRAQSSVNLSRPGRDR